MQFVDTNVFLRYLVNDEPTKAQRCLDLFLQAKNNKVSLTTSEAVIAEVVYVLISKRLYNLGRTDVVARLRPLLVLPGLKLPHRTILLRALEIYAAYVVDFEDALSKAHMERNLIHEIYSYDTDLDQMEGITRIEP